MGSRVNGLEPGRRRTVASVPVLLAMLITFIGSTGRHSLSER